jgi:hypothetical protein
MTVAQDFNSLFAPMSKKYCDLFFYLSFINFFMMVGTIIGLLFMFRDVKRNKFLIINSVILIAVQSVNYIYNRLLFNMCK